MSDAELVITNPEFRIFAGSLLNPIQQAHIEKVGRTIRRALRFWATLWATRAAENRTRLRVPETLA